MTQLLKIENLSVAFKNEDSFENVVHGVSIDVNKGEILGIVGESGSGKTVTCLTIMQLLESGAKITNGNILFKNHGDLLTLEEGALQKIRGEEISMIFQEPMSSLNPSHRCGRQVEEIILQHHKISKPEAKQQVLDLFEKVQLPDVERIYKSYIHQLSGGQLQRVMIAMALANKPDLIIADEPTTALDVTVQATVIDLLKDLAEEFDCAVIFISHDLGVVKKIADRVVVMQKGNIVEEGSVDEVFTNPSAKYTQGLIACRPPMDKRLNRLPTVEDFLSKSEKELTQFQQNLILDEESYRNRLDGLKQANPLLEVTNLCKYYPSKKSFLGKTLQYTKAVDDVSFNIRKGEILGLVGESGCGKSTLGRSILRLVEPTSGNVFYDGKDVLKMERNMLRKMRKNFQIILQDPYSSLNPRMKIGEAIREPMDVHKLNGNKHSRKEKVIDLLETVGLKADHFERYPHQFSGGQRQRISIARTLALNPSFIVCDESVSALDVSVQAQVLNLLLDLKDQFDLSLLFITHDMSVVKFISDYIMVMNEGKIVEYGDSEQIVNNPQNDYTQKLIEAIP